jgi:hypothetical protein
MLIELIPEETDDCNVLQRATAVETVSIKISK